MDLTAIVAGGLLAGASAAALAVVFTAPREYVVPTFVCGLVAWIVRDGLAAGGLGSSWATLLASVAAVLVAATATRRHLATPVVLISAVLPLGAAVAIFDAIIELFRVSTVTGAALGQASVALSASVGRGFSIFVAIALGLQIGVAILRLARSRPEE